MQFFDRPQYKGITGVLSLFLIGKEQHEDKQTLISSCSGTNHEPDPGGRQNELKTRTRSGDQITAEQMPEAVRDFGMELRGAGTDEMRALLFTGSFKKYWMRMPK